MATTPECLQKQFGIPAELGTVPVPRIIYAFDGIHATDRRAFQAVYLPAVMSGAIAYEGQHGYTVKGIREGVTQATMAGHAGTRRETVSQRLSKLAAPAKARTGRQQWLRARSLRNTNLAKAELHKLTCEPCATGCLCDEGKKLEARANMSVGDEADYQARPARSATAPIFRRRRRFGMASRYDLNVMPRRELPAIFEAESGIECKRFFDPAKAEVSCEKLNLAARERGSSSRYIVGTVEVDPKRFVYPTIEQLCGDPGGLVEVPLSGVQARIGALSWFDANFKKHGFKANSRWVWDPKLRDPDTGGRLGTIPRMVMSLYESMGLLEELRDKVSGKVTSAKGYLESKQDGIAAVLGISVRTLWAANCKWEKLGVLRIAAGNPRMTAKGIRRGKMLVIYLPFKQLTEKEAALELARVAARVREIVAKEGAQRLLQLLEAQRLNTELVNAWKGREHCMVALWREWARQMNAARIYPDLIDKLVPPLRPQELNEAWFDTQP